MNARFALASVVFAAFVLAGCAAREPRTPEERRTLHNEAQTAIQAMTSHDADMQNLLNNSYGYAIFPSVGKGGAIVGGAFGRGEVYSQGAGGARRIGFTELQQATIGAQLGGETYRELILFQNQAALDRFRAGNFEFSANASAVALKSGTAKAAKWNDGVIVFTLPIGGAMLEASIGGQKFSYQAVNPNIEEPSDVNMNRPTTRPI